MRIQGHELALIEVVAHIDRDHIIAGLAGIMEGISDEERVIWLQAMQLLDDAMRLYDPPAVGMHWPAA